MLGDRLVERGCHATSGHTLSRLQDRTPATKLIDHGQHPKSSTVAECIVDKIHAPALVCAARCGWNPAVQARVLAPTRPMAQLQPLDAVKTPYALHVDAPAVAPEQHVHAPIAVAG